MTALESAIFKLHWGAERSDFSVDLNGVECVAVLEVLEGSDRLTATTEEAMEGAQK